MTGLARPALTEPQLRALIVLVSQVPSGGRGTTPRTVARELWPDSKAWGRRTNRGSTPAGGAMGATMPMKGARMLHGLRKLGYASQGEYGTWSPTKAGREAVAANAPDDL